MNNRLLLGLAVIDIILIFVNLPGIYQGRTISIVAGLTCAFAAGWCGAYGFLRP
jgi:hypothetical protein